MSLPPCDVPKRTEQRLPLVLEPAHFRARQVELPVDVGQLAFERVTHTSLRGLRVVHGVEGVAADGWGHGSFPSDGRASHVPHLMHPPVGTGCRIEKCLPPRSVRLHSTTARIPSNPWRCVWKNDARVCV